MGALLNRREKGGFFYGYIIVLAAFFVMVIIAGIMHSYGVYLKPMSDEFGWTRAVVAGAYALTLFLEGIFFLLTGKWNDKFGPRVIVTVAAFSLGLGLWLMSQVSAAWQLYLFWGVIATIGFSGGLVPMSSTASRWFFKKRGLAVGIVLSGVGVGTAVIAPVASWLTSAYGWRTTWVFMSIIASVLLILAAQFLKRDPSKIGKLPYGYDEVITGNLMPGVTGLSFQEAVRTRQFWLACMMFLFLGTCNHTIVAHIVPLATDMRISSMGAASVLSVSSALNAVGRIGLGVMSDRIGIKSSLIIGMALMSIALIWLMAATELWMFYLFAVVFGFGTGGLVSLQSLVTADLFGLKAHGAILGVFLFSLTLGGSIGSFSAGYIYDTTNSYLIALLSLATLATAGIILALFYRSVPMSELPHIN